VLDGLTGALVSVRRDMRAGVMDVFTTAAGHLRVLTAEVGASGFTIWAIGEMERAPTRVRQAADNLPGINCVLALDGHRIFTGFVNGRVAAWDHDGVRLRAFHPPADVICGEVCVLKACPDRMVSGHITGFICVWDITVGAVGDRDGGEVPVLLPLAHMHLHDSAISRLEVLECEGGARRILAGDRACNAMLWDTDSGALLKMVPSGWCVGCLLPLEQADRAYHALVAGGGGEVWGVDLEERAPGAMVRSALKLG
jgi:hypothetical protein